MSWRASPAAENLPFHLQTPVFPNRGHNESTTDRNRPARRAFKPNRLNFAQAICSTPLHPRPLRSYHVPIRRGRNAVHGHGAVRQLQAQWRILRVARIHEIEGGDVTAQGEGSTDRP